MSQRVPSTMSSACNNIHGRTFPAYGASGMKFNFSRCVVHGCDFFKKINSTQTTNLDAWVSLLVGASWRGARVMNGRYSRSSSTRVVQGSEHGWTADSVSPLFPRILSRTYFSTCPACVLMLLLGWSCQNLSPHLLAFLLHYYTWHECFILTHSV